MAKCCNCIAGVCEGRLAVMHFIPALDIEYSEYRKDMMARLSVHGCRSGWKGP